MPARPKFALLNQENQAFFDAGNDGNVDNEEVADMMKTMGTNPGATAEDQRATVELLRKAKVLVMDPDRVLMHVGVLLGGKTLSGGNIAVNMVENFVVPYSLLNALLMPAGFYVDDEVLELSVFSVCLTPPAMLRIYNSLMKTQLEVHGSANVPPTLLHDPLRFFSELCASEHDDGRREACEVTKEDVFSVPAIEEFSPESKKLASSWWSSITVRMLENKLFALAPLFLASLDYLNTEARKDSYACVVTLDAALASFSEEFTFRPGPDFDSNSFHFAVQALAASLSGAQLTVHSTFGMQARDRAKHVKALFHLNSTDPTLQDAAHRQLLPWILQRYPILFSIVGEGCKSADAANAVAMVSSILEFKRDVSSLYNPTLFSSIESKLGPHASCFCGDSSLVNLPAEQARSDRLSALGASVELAKTNAASVDVQTTKKSAKITHGSFSGTAVAFSTQHYNNTMDCAQDIAITHSIVRHADGTLDSESSGLTKLLELSEAEFPHFSRFRKCFSLGLNWIWQFLLTDVYINKPLFLSLMDMRPHLLIYFRRMNFFDAQLNCVPVEFLSTVLPSSYIKNMMDSKLDLLSTHLVQHAKWEELNPNFVKSYPGDQSEQQRWNPKDAEAFDAALATADIAHDVYCKHAITLLSLRSLFTDVLASVPPVLKTYAFKLMIPIVRELLRHLGETLSIWKLGPPSKNPAPEISNSPTTPWCLEFNKWTELIKKALTALELKKSLELVGLVMNPGAEPFEPKHQREHEDPSKHQREHGDLSERAERRQKSKALRQLEGARGGNRRGNGGRGGDHRLDGGGRGGGRGKGGGKGSPSGAPSGGGKGGAKRAQPAVKEESLKKPKKGDVKVSSAHARGDLVKKCVTFADGTISVRVKRTGQDGKTIAANAKTTRVLMNKVGSECCQPVYVVRAFYESCPPSLYMRFCECKNLGDVKLYASHAKGTPYNDGLDFR